jgi:ribosomal protein L14
MVNLHRLKSNMKMNKNEGTKRLMIINVPELQEAVRREVVVGEVQTVSPEFLAAAPFAIHIAMQ